MTSPSRRPRLRALVLAATATAAFAVFGAAAPGAQAVTLFTCGGSSVTSFSPNLTNTAQTVTFSSRWVLGPCLNVLHPLELRSGSTTAVPHAVPGASCTTLDQGSSGTKTINWSTGGSSTFSYNQTASSVAGVGRVIVQQGTITSGDFNGDAILTEEVLASGEFLNCGTTGVSGSDGAVEVTISGA
jgi:hypothetical protein